MGMLITLSAGLYETGCFFLPSPPVTVQRPALTYIYAAVWPLESAISNLYNSPVTFAATPTFVLSRLKRLEGRYVRRRRLLPGWWKLVLIRSSGRVRNEEEGPER